MHKEFRFVGVVPPSYVNFKRRMNEKYLFVDLRFWSTSFQCFTFLFDCFVSFRFVQCFRLLFFRRLNYEIICLALSWHDIHFLRFANFQHVIGHDSIIKKKTNTNRVRKRWNRTISRHADGKKRKDGADIRKERKKNKRKKEMNEWIERERDRKKERVN